MTSDSHAMDGLVEVRLSRRPATPRVSAAGWHAAARSLLRSPAAGLAAILLLTAAIYAPTLDQWFVADDFWFLRRSQITSWETWTVQAFDFRDARPVPEFDQYRPMYLITFRAEYSLFGLHAWAYHLANVAVHLANVVLLWFIAARLTRRVWAAHLAAFIFALNPVYSDAVSWVSNGNTPMATAFGLLSFQLLMISIQRRSPSIYALFLVTLVASLLYHPEMLAIIALLPVWLFLIQGTLVDVVRPRRWMPLLPVIPVAVGYVAVQSWVRDHSFAQSAVLRVDWHMFDNYIDYLGFVIDRDPHGDVVAACMLAASAVLLTQWRWSWLAPFAVIWLYLTLAPLSTSALGAYERLLYFPGAAVGLFVAVAAMRVADWLSADIFTPMRSVARRIAPYAAVVAILPSVVLYRAADGESKKTVPFQDNTTAKQALANEQFIHQLRRELPALDPNGTLYVADAPFNLILFDAAALDNLVELYYGEVDVKVLPLREPPYWDKEQVGANLRPDDRLFVFKRLP